MSEGHVIIEYNQASHQPDLLFAGDLYADVEDARAEADRQRATTAEVGRRERYAVAEVTLIEDPR